MQKTNMYLLVTPFCMYFDPFLCIFCTEMFASSFVFSFFCFFSSRFLLPFFIRRGFSKTCIPSCMMFKVPVFTEGPNILLEHDLFYSIFLDLKFLPPPPPPTISFYFSFTVLDNLFLALPSFYSPR
jgi:hypothetical protein